MKTLKDREAEEKTAIITIDVEHASRAPSQGLENFLDIFQTEGIRATFFITHEIASEKPELIDKIDAQGHEIASHGYNHPLPGEGQYLTQLKEEEMVSEVKRSYEFLNELGMEPQGIRFPNFKVNHSILKQASRYFDYDSSIIPRWPKTSQQRSSKLLEGIDNLEEVPISGLKGIKVRLGAPVFLGLGPNFLNYLIKLCGVELPLVFYAHAYDLAQFETAPLPNSYWKRKWYFERCGPDKKYFFDKFLSFLEEGDYNFCTCSDFIAKDRD